MYHIALKFSGEKTFADFKVFAHHELKILGQNLLHVMPICFACFYPDVLYSAINLKVISSFTNL